MSLFKSKFLTKEIPTDIKFDLLNKENFAMGKFIMGDIYLDIMFDLQKGIKIKKEFKGANCEEVIQKANEYWEQNKEKIEAIKEL